MPGSNKSFGQKLMLDFSLAGERYKTPVWDEWDVYPVLNVTYLPKPGHILQLSFSSDKSYPSYWEVQDAVSYLGGGYSEIQGNPLLKPEKDYQLSLSYILKSKYVFSFWFRPNACWRYTAPSISTSGNRQACRLPSPSRRASGLTHG